MNFLALVNPAPLPPQPNQNLYCVEASRGHPPDERVYAFGLYHFSTGREWVIAAETVGGCNLSASEIREDADVHESAVLAAFQEWAARNPAAILVHWHQSRSDYGFAHWARRAGQHLLLPWPNMENFDLSNHLRLLYGDDHFGGHPKFRRALENNNIATTGILTAEGALAARDSRDWTAINKSLQRKVVALSKLYECVSRGEYKYPAPHWPPGDTAGRWPPDAWLSHIDLADHAKLAREPLRKRLDRWRRRHMAGDDWKEVPERKPREPRYLYRLGAVMPIVNEMAAGASGETSG